MNRKPYTRWVGSVSALHRIGIGPTDENPSIESARSQPGGPALNSKGDLIVPFTCTECIGDSV